MRFGLSYLLPSFDFAQEKAKDYASPALLHMASPAPMNRGSWSATLAPLAGGSLSLVHLPANRCTHCSQLSSRFAQGCFSCIFSSWIRRFKEVHQTFRTQKLLASIWSQSAFGCSFFMLPCPLRSQTNIKNRAFFSVENPQELKILFRQV